MVEYYRHTRRKNLVFPPPSLTLTARHTQSLHDAAWRNSLNHLSFFELRKLLTFSFYSSRIFYETKYINGIDVSSKLWSSQIWKKFMQLVVEAWKGFIQLRVEAWKGQDLKPLGSELWGLNPRPRDTGATLKPIELWNRKNVENYLLVSENNNIWIK